MIADGALSAWEFAERMDQYREDEILETRRPLAHRLECLIAARGLTLKEGLQELHRELVAEDTRRAARRATMNRNTHRAGLFSDAPLEGRQGRRPVLPLRAPRGRPETSRERPHASSDGRDLDLLRSMLGYEDAAAMGDAFRASAEYDGTGMGRAGYVAAALGFADTGALRRAIQESAA